MDDKEKVVNRLIGCECEHCSKYCEGIHPIDHYSCSRGLGHTGKHIACGGEGLHKIIEW